MWRLCHKLFGWDYVFIEGHLVSNIRRIKIAPNGREYVTPWASLKDPVFLDRSHGWTITHLTRDTSNNN